MNLTFLDSYRGWWCVADLEGDGKSLRVGRLAEKDARRPTTADVGRRLIAWRRERQGLLPPDQNWGTSRLSPRFSVAPKQVQRLDHLQPPAPYSPGYTAAVIPNILTLPSNLSHQTCPLPMVKPLAPTRLMHLASCRSSKSLSGGGRT